jgi:hypothetical protein
LLLPVLTGAGKDENTGIRFGEPALAFRRGNAALVKLEVGSLATGERTMLSGCELGNGAYCVVEHFVDGTRGVSHRDRRGAGEIAGAG